MSPVELAIPRSVEEPVLSILNKVEVEKTPAVLVVEEIAKSVVSVEEAPAEIASLA